MNNNFNYNKLTPFKWFVLENFPFIEADFDALTEWQLFCKIGKELNKIITSTNSLGTQVETLTDYVENYFNNLDVQEEINKKLNDMAQSGELENLIGEFLELNSLLCFNNVAEMTNSENVIDGSFAQTLGFYSINDGGKALYKIRTITNKDIVDNASIIALNKDNLIAEIILDKELNVKQFGAKGDMNNDDTEFIQKAINYASNKNLCVVIDKNTYLITSTLIINTINQNFKCYGTLKTEQEITVIRVSKQFQNIFINKIIKTGNLLGTGLELYGHNFYNNIEIGEINGFEYGLKLSTIEDNNSGIQYCNIKTNYLNNKYDIYLESSGTGWINQNYFCGGQLSGFYGIYFKKNASEEHDQYNGNYFKNFGFEGNNIACHLENCRHNTFKDFRLIELLSNTSVWIESIENSRLNLFESNSVESLDFTKINDSNTNGYEHSNLYKIRTGNNSSFNVVSENYIINNGLPILKDYLKATESIYQSSQSDEIINTNIAYKFDLLQMIVTDLSGNLTINLDERYENSNTLYDEFIIKVGYRASEKNLIINKNDGTEIFNLNSLTQEAGNINKTYLIKKLPRGTLRLIQNLS